MEKAFVSELSDYFGISKDSIFLFGSARMGLYTLLKTLYSSSEDEVIVAGYTCVVVTNAIKYAGLKAKYVDISEETMNIDTRKLYAQITPRVKAIIISHNFGITYDDIILIKEKYPHIVLIEDAAHALGSKYTDGTMVGLKGDASFFSLEYSKPITTGLGGVLIVNSKMLISSVSVSYCKIGYLPGSHVLKILISLMVHLLTSYPHLAPLKSVLFRALQLFKLAALTSQDEIAGALPKHYPVRLSPVLAYFGYLQLKDIAPINKLKAAIASEYNVLFSQISKIITVYDERYVYVRYPVIFRSEVDIKKIKRIKSRITRETGFQVGEWFNDVVHPKGSYRYCYSAGNCPVGESVSTRIINFPVGIHVKINETTRSAIRKILYEEL